MSTKVDHIGIAVRSLSERLPFWQNSLGLDLEALETVETEKVKVASLRAGACRIELLEATDQTSAVARSLAKRGEGIHHLTLEVDDLSELLDHLRQQGVTVLGEAPRPGAGGRQIAFLHPAASGGVLVELAQARAAAPVFDIEPGCSVLLYLHDPQEKLWGVLRRLDAAGAVLEAIDLASFDDWVSQIERGEESVVGPSLLFVPMARVERIVLDRTTGQIPSLAERFQRRTGRTVQDVLGHFH